MALYPAPRQVLPTYNPTALNISSSGNTNIDQAFLDANYLKFPTAQGTENFGSILVASDETIKGNLLMSGTNNINYIQFPDGSQQFSAPGGVDVNTVYNDVSNTFLSPYTQTFNGPVNISSTLNMQNNNITNISSLYGNSTNNILTIQSLINMASGQSININSSALYLYDAGLNTNISFTGNQCSFNNGGSYAGNAGFNFALNNSIGSLQTVLNIASAEIDSYTNLNMNTNSITNVNSINVGTVGTGTNTQLTQGGSTFGINNTYPYTSAPQISLAVYSSTGLVGMTISQSAVSCGSLAITNAPSISAPTGLYVTTTTPPNGDNTTKIATTAWVTANAAAPPVLTNYAQLNTTNVQTFTGANDFTGVTTAITCSPPTLSNTQLATTAFVAGASAVITNSVANSATTTTSIVSGTNQSTSQFGKNAVLFFSNPIKVNIGTTITGNVLITLAFTGNPWPAFPSTQSGTIGALCTNNNNYWTFNYAWITTGLLITYPSGSQAYRDATIQYVFDLSTIGIILA